MHIVGVVGSREYPRMDDVTAFVRGLAAKYPDAIVVSGGARGVDRVAALSAQRVGLSTVEFLVVEQSPDVYVHELRVIEAWGQPPIAPIHIETWTEWCDGWYSTFRDAAFARNTWIVKASTQVVSFWDGQSNGTANTHQEATRLRVPLYRKGV